MILQKLEEEIHLRGFSHHTHEEYMIRAKSFMLYANRLLEELTEQEIRAYLLYLLDVKKLSVASVNGNNSALRFLYGAILHRHINYYDIPCRKSVYTSSMRILIRQGKGKRDRFTLLSKTNLDVLTKYWYTYKPQHPNHYLFLNRSKNKMTTRGAANIFKKALLKSGVQ